MRRQLPLLPRPLPLTLAGAVLVAGIPLVPVGPAEAATTEAQVAALAPAAQAVLLQPLRRLADDLAGQGRAWASTYAGVQLRAAARTVTLYSTGATAARAQLKAARRSDPRADWTEVRLHTAPHSRAALDAAAARVVAADPVGVDTVAVPVDGSALKIRLVPGAPAAALPPGLGVSVTVSRAPADVAKSWAAIKWHDRTPFIGGDVLTTNGHHYCTAGLPAVRRSDSKPVMVTAGHCFTTGQRVYTAAGKPGARGNGRHGTYVGTVGRRQRTVDAEFMTGTDNNADESDTRGWKPLTSVARDHVGDYVCQAGAASFFLGHPTPCGIRVTDDDVWWRIHGHWAHGVEGVDVRHGWGSHNGDSGGTVFAVEPHGKRQARGIVSSGGRDGTTDQKRVDWTEAVDILAAGHLELNPKT